MARDFEFDAPPLDYFAVAALISRKVAAGTKIYIGEVGSQGGFYVGGTQQIVVPTSWAVPGIKIVEIKPIK